MMDHKKIREQVALDAAGALRQEESLEVRRHLGECETCRREFEVLSAYVGGLKNLPQPVVPSQLVARTQARILRAHVEARSEAASAAMFGALAAFSWLMTYASWTFARWLSGGSVEVFGVNLLDAGPWFATSFAVTAITAGVAALMLSNHRQARRVL